MVCRNLLAFAVASLLSASCAKAPVPLSMDRWRDAENRQFSGKSPNEVLDAAEKVFRLLDEKRFRFVRLENKLVAIWTLRNMFGDSSLVFDWVVETRKLDDGVNATADVAVQRQVYLVYQFGAHPRQRQARSIAAYETLWARIDFILGRSTAWPDCEDIERKYGNIENDNIASFWVWCHLSFDDIRPERPERK